MTPPQPGSGFNPRMVNPGDWLPRDARGAEERPTCEACRAGEHDGCLDEACWCCSAVPGWMAYRRDAGGEEGSNSSWTQPKTREVASRVPPQV